MLPVFLGLSSRPRILAFALGDLLWLRRDDVKLPAEKLQGKTSIAAPVIGPEEPHQGSQFHGAGPSQAAANALLERVLMLL